MKIQIVRQRELEVGSGEAATKIIKVTYSMEGYPPRTLWIDRSKYSKQAVIDYIKADIKYSFRLDIKEVELVGWEPLA